MKIERIKNEPNALWKISGIIDSDNYHELEEELLKLNFDNLALTIDMTEVPYITSATIRVLLMCRKQMPKEKLILANANSEVKEIFVSSGFDDMVTFIDKANDDDILHKSFKDLLKDNVDTIPEKLAYVQEGVSYTWLDVEKCSQIIADDLANAGVVRGTHVGICSANSINWYLTFFAIQKLGAIATFLNFNTNIEEIIKMTKIGNITHICFGVLPRIDDKETFFKEVKSNCGIVEYIYDMDSNVDFRERYDEYDAIKYKYREKVRADAPSVIIFTSGSTGNPKGVITSTYNRLISALCLAKNANASEDDRACVYIPLFHALGFIDMNIIPLIKKMTTYVCPNTKIESILKTIYENKCTYFASVPTLLVMMINHPEFSEKKIDTLRYTMVAGEPVSESQMRELHDAMPNNHFGAMYGMSEIVPISMTEYDEDIDHVAKTVGKPYEGVKVKILDIATGVELEKGKEGEIAVYSETSMIGYYKLEVDKQAMDNAGYVKTGDVGYIDDEGYLRLTGRCKELIIRAGENISPNEIAAAIKEQGDIENVKVVGIPDEKYGEGIAAAIVMKKGKAFDKDNMNLFLSEKIAKYKIPVAYVSYDEFPLLSNGKIDGVGLKKDVIKKLGLGE